MLDDPGDLDVGPQLDEAELLDLGNAPAPRGPIEGRLKAAVNTPTPIAGTTHRVISEVSTQLRVLRRPVA